MGERNLYIPEGVDKGRVDDPEIARAVAFTEKPIRQVADKRMFKQTKKNLTKVGEEHADEIGRQMFSERERERKVGIINKDDIVRVRRDEAGQETNISFGERQLIKIRDKAEYTTPLYMSKSKPEEAGYNLDNFLNEDELREMMADNEKFRIEVYNIGALGKHDESHPDEFDIGDVRVLMVARNPKLREKSYELHGYPQQVIDIIEAAIKKGKEEFYNHYKLSKEEHPKDY